MAYTVLARRYRSNTFDEVVGQNHIAQTLKKAIASGRIAHAYLFCGTRGTGKTSTARILAKCLNCQSADHAVTEPCNKCDSCKSIAKGDDIDVIEIDAASNTGVDNVRDIIIGTAYNMPARSRFKVFIIDEVHMLSKAAFNALLKTLEEPPSHVKFILATTEPEKVLPTILSRCQRYDFRNIPTREIAAHLKAICKTEKIEADDDALLLVAKAGAGSMRDSLSLLDRLLSIGETKLTVGLLEQLLGLPKSQLIFDLVAGVGAGDVQSVLTQADQIISNGLAVDTLIVSLTDHLRNLMLLRTCGSKSDLVEVPGLSLVDLSKQAELFDAGALSQDIVILEELRRNVRQSQAGRALLDATLVRMALADQFSSLSALAELARGGSAVVGQKKKDEVASTSQSVGEGSTFNARGSTSAKETRMVVPPAPVPARVMAVTAVEIEDRRSNIEPPTSNIEPPTSNIEPPTSNSETAVEDDDDSLPMPGRVWEGPRESLAAMMAKHVANTKAEIANVVPVGNAELSGKWKEMLGLLGPAMSGVLQHGELIGVEDGLAIVRFGPTHETFVKRLELNGKKDLIRDSLTKVMAQPMGVRFEISSSAATPTVPAPVAKSAPAPVPPVQPARRASVAPPPMVAQESSNSIRVTDELRENLYKANPLVRAIAEQLGGNIIKFEE
jgi:DNA polymerase-3 subunit gamma/tau